MWHGEEHADQSGGCRWVDAENSPSAAEIDGFHTGKLYGNRCFEQIDGFPVANFSLYG
ncbi:hypothetical protein [Paenibacillus oryzisoli]|uniref:hypothetical protein n=1 Tax=Paenibacillus oryzisoli TaxID=1850517 RepID=UPI0019586583|nr:hypothetical protein [Paenibacillus oryzisoli]